eukprot:INCI586.2.p1 GENE.INCI586.2~~INCI586.2.p1  ORF type:complete len:598 (+),score=87.19 INCI586.2:309-2102(+)
MGAGASAPGGRTAAPRRPVTQQDSALLDHIIRTCEAESALYTKRIQDNANFACEFADKSKQQEREAAAASRSPSQAGRQQRDADADIDGGFANSKGSVIHDNEDDDDDERYSQGGSSSSRSLAEANQRRARKFADLMAWLGRSGAYMPQVGVCEVGEAGFAVFSKTDIAESKSVLKIPLSCLVTDTLAAGTPTGRLLADLRDKVAALAHCQLSVFLLEDMERGPKSCFHAYYQSLPQQLPQHSLFWTTEEKSLLRGTCFLDDVQSFEVMVKTDYETIVNRLPAFRRFSFAKFLWSRIIVSSRNFSIRINHSDHIALVPLADMMNHHEPRRTAWEYRDDDRAFVITSLDSFRAGSQITNSYGQKSASQLLLHYGFIPNNFGQNRVELIENQITMHLSPKFRRHPGNECGSPSETGLAPAATPISLDLGHTSIARHECTNARSRSLKRINSGSQENDFKDKKKKKKHAVIQPQNVWQKRKLLGDPHVFRMRVNVAHRETASCLRYLSVLATANKHQIQRIKRIEKADDSTAPLPVFFDMEHLLETCAIMCELARERCSQLDVYAWPLSAIYNYNNLNAWCGLGRPVPFCRVVCVAVTGC